MEKQLVEKHSISWSEASTAIKVAKKSLGVAKNDHSRDEEVLELGSKRVFEIRDSEEAAIKENEFK